MIKLVAFDWNGTIISDTKQVWRSEKLVMDHFGLPGHSMQRMRDHYQIPIREYWKSLGFDLEIYDQNAQKIYEIFMADYDKNELTFRTRSGVKELTTWLHKEKITSVIFSNHEVPRIERQLVRLKLSKYFDKILARTVGDSSHMHARSKETKLSVYVKSLKLKPAQVMTVGDTMEEIEIAKQYGYVSAAISGGTQSVKRLKSLRPNYLVHNLTELKKIISQINGSR